MIGMTQLSQNVKIRLVKAYQGAGTSPFASDEVDMQGWDGVTFIAKFGTSNAGNTFKLQHDTATGMASAVDLLGTSVVPSANACLAVMDVYKPLERFIRAYATIGSSSTLEFIIAIQYQGHVLGDATLNNVTNVVMSELHVSPIAGTA